MEFDADGEGDADGDGYGKTSLGSLYTWSAPDTAVVLGIVLKGCVGSSTQSQNPFWAYTLMDVAPLHAAMAGTCDVMPK